MKWKKWDLVVKLDPDKELSDEAWQTLLKANIDAVIIGGTQNITTENSIGLYKSLVARGYIGVVLQELTDPEVILPEVNGYLLPLVLNTSEMTWLRDAHLSAISLYGSLIPWEKVIPVSYLVCNDEAAVAKKTKSSAPNIDEAIAYLSWAENVLNQDLFYIECSGAYGEPELVRAISRKKSKANIIYGGGIKTVVQALEMKPYCDTLVIGNIMYENPQALMKIKKALD